MLDQVGNIIGLFSRVVLRVDDFNIDAEFLASSSTPLRTDTKKGLLSVEMEKPIVVAFCRRQVLQLCRRCRRSRK